MISFRYHVVSIVAVFLALALGVVVGTTALNGPITTNLRQQVDSLKSDRSSLASQNQALQLRAANSDEFASTFAPLVIASSLKGKNVVIVGMPGASSSMKDGISRDITAAGGTLTGRIQLTGDYTDPRRANDIKSLVTTVHPIGLTLPATNDAGVLGGSLLGFVLLSGQAQQTDTDSVLNSLVKLQMTKVESSNVAPADLAVIVGSGTLPVKDPGGLAQLSLVTQFQSSGGHTIVAGDSPTATGGGLVALVRADAVIRGSVASVDDADTAMGQVAATLALANSVTGKGGAYGTGPGATSLFPTLPK